MSEQEPLELVSASGTFEPQKDERPKMPEPLPVRVVAVSDVALAAPAGIEQQLDEFYVKLLLFVRDSSRPLAYQADNFRIVFDVREAPVERQDYRILQIEVESLGETELKLVEAEIEYTRQCGLLPGTESLLLMDPAGNWLELVERREIG